MLAFKIPTNRVMRHFQFELKWDLCLFLFLIIFVLTIYISKMLNKSYRAITNSEQRMSRKKTLPTGGKRPFYHAMIFVKCEYRFLLHLKKKGRRNWLQLTSSSNNRRVVISRKSLISHWILLVIGVFFLRSNISTRLQVKRCYDRSRNVFLCQSDKKDLYNEIKKVNVAFQQKKRLFRNLNLIFFRKFCISALFNELLVICAPFRVLSWQILNLCSIPMTLSHLFFRGCFREYSETGKVAITMLLGQLPMNVTMYSPIDRVLGTTARTLVRQP